MATPNRPADPPIDEIRRVRHEISAEFGHDVGRMMDYYREVEQRHPGRVIIRRVERPIALDESHAEAA